MRIHVRHNRAATGSASEFRLGLGGTPSEGYGCMTAASNGLGSGGLDSRRGISTGFGREDRSLTEDLPWALGRQEDTTSSEIACQLFSGLGASRAGARGEGRFYMSGMGVGIGTTIGGRNSPGTGGTIYRGRTQSVQTIELSDQTEQYLFSEEQAYYPSVSHDTEERLQQQQLGEATSESDCGGMDSPEDGFSIRVGEYDEQEEADELKELGLYSDHSSDRGSPIEEFGGDDYSNDEDVSYGELQEDHDVAVDQLGGQSSDDSDYSDESNYDTEDMNHEEGHDYIDEFEEVEGRQGQMCDDGLTRSLSSSQASTISERLQPN
ncbi:hypothetical protein EC991_010675 [Linnemannia zychae]|nr:hypothetical protein EC991_010675 [Linnemannia zychae]